MADEYTHGHHESVLRSHTWRTLDNSAAYLTPYLRAGQRVLDVGSGPGTITVDLAERVAPGEVRGVDAAAEVVTQAVALAVQRGLANVSFAVGDAYQLDEPEGSYDVVHAHQVLQHLARPVDALREFRRVLAPGAWSRCATSTTRASSGTRSYPLSMSGCRCTSACIEASAASLLRGAD